MTAPETSSTDLALSNATRLYNVVTTLRTASRVTTQVAAWVWPRRHLILTQLTGGAAPQSAPATPPAPAAKKLRWAIPLTSDESTPGPDRMAH